MGIVRNGGPKGIFGNPEDVYGRKRWFGPQQFDGPQQHEDFLGVALDARWGTGADTGCTAAISAAQGGVLLLSTDGTDDDRVHVFGELNWYPNKEILFETRLKVDNIAGVHVVAGLTDAKGEGSQLLPVELAGTTWTTTATDFIGFNFDTDATTDVWYGMGVAADTDKTAVQSTSAWANATYIKLGVLVQSDGASSFLIDDVPVGRIAAPASTIATALCPFVGLQNRSASARALSVDYIYVAGKRS